MNRLEIQIATHGHEGLSSIMSRPYPQVDGVRYHIGWQGGTSQYIADDMIVSGNDACSLTDNRNYLIANADAEIILFSDDDIAYTIENINDILTGFEQHPDVDFICFKLDRPDKKYPDSSFDIARPMPGYFPSSCEIAVKKSFLDKYQIQFDTRFGLGARFICFEELRCINSLLKNGAKGLYLPVVIGRHESICSTGTNPQLSHKVNVARGASFALINPFVAPMRLMVQAMRTRSFNHFLAGMHGYFSVLFRPNRCDI